eukprot:TRINITY_DN39766_c0_g1_i1.p1 TRINITY_DN39766_c0_g1~~TRINITY_DN39766_c0_g1_i1.p1  ORF type:complete len:599 (+),score=84.74 TRINITY_DN39766_c0_g1_i1:65-1861(+)
MDAVRVMPAPPGQNPHPAHLPVRLLHFTHDTIRPVFHAGAHRSNSLYTLINDLCKDAEGTIARLPPLEIVWHDNGWRCLSNRRLWCLKCYAGISGSTDLSAKVHILPEQPRQFFDKNTSQDDGCSVQVVGNEDALRQKFSSSSGTCRHFFSSRGCNKGSRCSFSHDAALNALSSQEERNDAESQLSAYKEKVSELEIELKRLKDACSHRQSSVSHELEGSVIRDATAPTGTMSSFTGDTPKSSTSNKCLASYCVSALNAESQLVDFVRAAEISEKDVQSMPPLSRSMAACDDNLAELASTFLPRTLVSGSSQKVSDAVGSVPIFDSVAVFGQDEVPVSSAVLRLASPEFEAVYSSQTAKSQPYRFEVEIASKDAFIEFYTVLLPLQGPSTVTENNVVSVLALAEHFQVPNTDVLVKACSGQLSAKLQSAVIKCDYNTARACLKLGADPNMKCSDGGTLLHMCATGDDSDFCDFEDKEWKTRVSFALKNGCDITIQDANAMTALDMLEKQTQSARDAFEDDDDYEMHLLVGGSYCADIEEWWQTAKRREKYMRKVARTTSQAAGRLCNESEDRRSYENIAEKDRERGVRMHLYRLNPDL